MVSPCQARWGRGFLRGACRACCRQEMLTDAVAVSCLKFGKRPLTLEKSSGGSSAKVAASPAMMAKSSADISRSFGIQQPQGSRRLLFDCCCHKVVLRAASSVNPCVWRSQTSHGVVTASFQGKRTSGNFSPLAIDIACRQRILGILFSSHHTSSLGARQPVIYLEQNLR